MDSHQFDDLARGLARGLTRRQALKLLAGGLFGGLLARVGLGGSSSATAPAAAQTSEYNTFLPFIRRSKGTGCPEASTCEFGDTRFEDKKYCSADRTCACLRTPEGDIRCGKIPSCGADNCKVSSDCAHLGTGAFCDTPYSGCCPGAAEQQRCVLPCDAPPCPPDRDCDGTCCPLGMRCQDGACVSTSGLTCPDERDTCINCLAFPHDTSCTEHCNVYQGAKKTCELAFTNANFLALEQHLLTQGFAPSGEEPRALERREYLEDGAFDVRRLFAARFVNGGSGEGAVLLFGLEQQTGAHWALAIVDRDDRPQYAWRVGSGGAIERVDPPASALNHRPDKPDFDYSEKCRECSVFCKAAGKIWCGAAGGLACGENPICILVGAGICEAPAEAYCPDYCNSALGPALNVDPHNCGACGTRCPGQQECCEGVCADLLTARNHCGNCDTVCPSGQICCAGRCEESPCCEYPQHECSGFCCPLETPCASEGGCCPSTRLCNEGAQCCEPGESCITRSDGSQFCCPATLACQNGSIGGSLEVCCREGQRCHCNLGECRCVAGTVATVPGSY